MMFHAQCSGKHLQVLVNSTEQSNEVVLPAHFTDKAQRG